MGGGSSEAGREGRKEGAYDNDNVVIGTYYFLDSFVSSGVR